MLQHNIPLGLRASPRAPGKIPHLGVHNSLQQHARFLHMYPFISQQNPKGSRKWGNRERWDASHQEVKCKQPLGDASTERRGSSWSGEREIEEETISEREDIKPIILHFFFLFSSVFFCPQAPSDKFSEFSIREAAALRRGLSLYQTDRQEVNAAWQDLT